MRLWPTTLRSEIGILCLRPRSKSFTPCFHNSLFSLIEPQQFDLQNRIHSNSIIDNICLPIVRDTHDMYMQYPNMLNIFLYWMNCLKTHQVLYSAILKPAI